MFERRIDQLQKKLAASTRAGKPLPGYKVRVDALRAEISRLQNLETARPVTSDDSGEGNQDSPDRFAPGVDTLPEPA